MSFDFHAALLEQLSTLLHQRVLNGWDPALMTQSELSRRSGVHYSTLSKMIRHNRPVTEDTWQKLFNAAMLHLDSDGPDPELPVLPVEPIPFALVGNRRDCPKCGHTTIRQENGQWVHVD